MKTDTVFKRAFNDALDLLSELGDGEPLPSENALSAQLGVSRTTVRKVLATLASARHCRAERGRSASFGRAARQPQRFPEAETVSDVRAGREALHGVDAARRHAPGTRSTSSNWPGSSASPPPASASS